MRRRPMKFGGAAPEPNSHSDCFFDRRREHAHGPIMTVGPANPEGHECEVASSGTPRETAVLRAKDRRTEPARTFVWPAVAKAGSRRSCGAPRPPRSAAAAGFGPGWIRASWNRGVIGRHRRGRRNHVFPGQADFQGTGRDWSYPVGGRA